MVVRGLLFDVGGVLMWDSWRLLDVLERELGITIAGRGPLDPDADPVWQRHLAGELDQWGYWDTIARNSGFADGLALLVAATVEVPEPELYRPEAIALMTDARSAGLKVGILSNDLVRFGGEAWVARQAIFADVDALCDATRAGVRKPDPQAYLLAAEALGLAPREVLFFDDLQANVYGSRAAGMPAVLVDELDANPAFALGRKQARLPPAAP